MAPRSGGANREGAHFLIKKFEVIFLKKGIDKRINPCYNNYRKREEEPQDDELDRSRD